jgi:hypothetical protein
VIHRTADVDPFSVRVGVYWNLSRHVWSIKTDEPVAGVARGKLIGWADGEPFALMSVMFHVNVTQHRNALAGIGKRGTKRNVVAWVVGKLTDGSQADATGRRATFHWPDARSTFHFADTGAPITNAGVAVFTTIADADGRPHGIVHVGDAS